MIKAAYSSYVSEEALHWSLVLMTAFSWFIFPLMAKQINPAVFHIGFAICFFSVSILVAIASTRNKFVPQSLHKLMLACWTIYLLALLLATIGSTSAYSFVQWFLLIAKFLFFVFILLYLNEKYIVATLRIYANIMVVTVFFAFIAVISFALGIQPLAKVDFGGTLGDVYFGAYYVPNTSIFMPAPIFRIQGLSEEPGTYAFSLLPAFFWLLIAEKAYVRSAVIVLGLMFTMSFGAGLFLLLLVPVMAFKYSVGHKVPAFFLSAVCLVGMMYIVSSFCINRHFENMDNTSVIVMGGNACKKGVPFERGLCIDEMIVPSLSTSTAGKVHSFQDRVGGILAAWSYLKSNGMGTGTALGMTTVKNSISVGYVVAILETGVVGGIFYLCLFAVMGLQALKTLATSNNGSFEEQVKVVVALSVCAVLMMGAQRIQPDLSLWHMWIYAMWFYLLRKIPSPRVAC